MAKDIKLAFIIPTKGRYEKLKILLDSIEIQTSKPDLIIIVDSNKEYSKNRISNHSFPIKYLHTGPNSLTEARNIGIKNVPKDFSLIGFLDDDVILSHNALGKMLAFWKGASLDIGGVAFNIINRRKPRKLWFLKKVFLMGDFLAGNVLPSGYQTMVDKVRENTFTQWLPGGVTVWRREVLEKFQFDENLKGYGYIEDLDFSYRVGKEYKLLSLAEAQLIHNPHPIPQKNGVKFGILEITNRFYFISKHREFSRFLFYWASLGKMLENFVMGGLSFKVGYLKRAWGNILGLSKVVRCKKGDFTNG